MNISAPVKCRAKNPATCKHHGKPVTQVSDVGAKTKSKASVSKVDSFSGKVSDDAGSASDKFEAALSRSTAFQRIEAQLFYKNSVVTELREQQLKRNVPVSDVREGLTDYSNPENVKLLHEFNAEYDKVSAGWSDSQKEAVQEYTGISNEPVNRLLRDEDGYAARLKPESRERVLKRVKGLVDELDSVFASAPVSSEPRTVYRVVSQDLTKEFTSSEKFADKLGVGSVGEVVEFKTFLSSTVDPHFVGRWVGDDEENTAVVFVISSRSGVPVSRTATDSTGHRFTQDTEREVLLPRNMRFKVREVSRGVGFSPSEHYTDEVRMVSPLTVFLDELPDAEQV